MSQLPENMDRYLGFRPEMTSLDQGDVLKKEENLSKTGMKNAPPASSAASGTAAPRIRRRNRMITSCLECRRRKLKCDKSHPCSNCTKSTRDCLFLAPALDSASQLKLNEIKEKMGSLERVLEQDVAKKGARIGPRRGVDDEEIDFAPEPEDEKDLEPTPLALKDVTYDDNADDDLRDLGFMMGKVRITDRVGGFFRPKMAEELTMALKDEKNDLEPPADDAVSPSLPSLYNPESSPDSFLAPGPTYLAPSSNFFFANATSSLSLVDYLPSRTVADRLLDRYWVSVHSVARVVHKPSFLRRYEIFWDDILSGIEPPGSLQAVIFAAMFSGAVSISEDIILMDFGVSKKDLVNNFQSGTEYALGRANITRTTKIETLQAFVMYLIPLCRGEVSRSHSVLCGTAIRIAECMGLHRDGTEFGLGPVETHVRRMVWYQLCCMDIRTCEAQGPRPAIRAEDFNTRFPLNVDDDELESSNPPKQSASRWTDVSLSLIRCECIEMQRVIWVERPRLEKKLISLTAVLGKVENFRKMMRDKYLPLMNDSIPDQHYGHLLMELLTTRMYAMVLHRYYNSVTDELPDRLRQILIPTSIETVETAIEMDRSPLLSPWAWFAGAHQQYLSAIILVVEIIAFPMHKEADRIWACLDYVFEVPTYLKREQKARWIIVQLRDKMEAFASTRTARAPVGLLDDPRLQPSRKPYVPNDPRISLGQAHDPGNSWSNAPHSYVMGKDYYDPYQNLTKEQGNFELYQTQQTLTMPLPLASDDRMVDIDWHEWDKLFPPNPQIL